MERSKKELVGIDIETYVDGKPIINFDLGTGDKSVSVLVVDDASDISAKAISLLSKEHGMDVIVLGAGAHSIHQDFSKIEARIAAAFGVPKHLHGNRVAESFHQIGLSAQQATEAMLGFKRLISEPIGLRPCVSRLDVCEEPNHPHGWYRKFDKVKGKRNLK